MQPASSGNGRCRRGQAKTEREGSRFGLSGCAKLLVVRKHRASFHPAKASPEEVIRLFLPARRVIGGVACSKWLATLTGESPTPFRSLLRTSQAHKSTTKRL
jgi:hypothetical protein